jgi:glutamate N-acetyltransferase/amino-acid N-acetyltransferase
VQAAPVRLARQHLKASRGAVRAVLVNAGNANCATRSGDRVALLCCRAAARELKITTSQVIPASTGVIGVELDGQLIVNALPRLVAGLSERRFPDVARAIMTTDLVPKVAFGEMSCKKGIVGLAGVTKGSGMIHPRLATTLAFVITDAELSAQALKPILARAAERTYNRLSVDGDTSTNDIVLLMANGASGIRPDQKERVSFEAALTSLLEDLARQIARDGEGAGKLITIHVSGAPSESSAAQIARSIANSPLVKTAIAGSDPNWGRILSAAGNAGVPFDPSDVDIFLQHIPVCRSGLAAAFSENDLKHRLNEHECLIRFVIRGRGKGEARFFTCDLTEGYIRINASYRT